MNVAEKMSPLTVGQIQPPCATCQGKEWGFCVDLHYGTCVHFKTEAWRPEYFSLDYLRKGKEFLRKVIDRREQLRQHEKGYVPGEYRAETETIKYHLGNIKSAAQLRNYLLRKETAIRFIIPSNMRKWHDEFRELLETEV